MFISTWPGSECSRKTGRFYPDKLSCPVSLHSPSSLFCYRKFPHISPSWVIFLVLTSAGVCVDVIVFYCFVELLCHCLDATKNKLWFGVRLNDCVCSRRIKDILLFYDESIKQHVSVLSFEISWFPGCETGCVRR